MYITRPLSLYKNSPDSISTPPEGPNSGYLILHDEESSATSCFGMCNDPELRTLPFPQNKLLTVHHSSGVGEDSHTEYHDVYLIPVINQPLSVNRYYAIEPHGKHKGEAYASSKEQDKGSCLCFNYIKDVKPRPLEPDDIYQQYEFSESQTCTNSRIFSARSIAPDGYPPQFMRWRRWKIRTSSSKKFILNEASGLNSALRVHLPDFDFPFPNECSPSVEIGKWYCPFMFVKEKTLKEQVKCSLFYEMKLEQRWERIFSSENNYREGSTVNIDVPVPTEVVLVAGRDAVRDETNKGDDVVWFKSMGSMDAGGSVGLSSLIIERMTWEQRRAGWENEKGKQVRVVRVEEYGGIGWWGKFGCYVLVERFSLKRMDGSSVLTYDFYHTHQIKSKWQ